MTLSHIPARWRHDGVVAAVGECVDDLPCIVHKGKTVACVAEPVAYAAIGYENYIATEVWEVGVKVRPCSDHSEATRWHSQWRDGIDIMVIADFPVNQANRLACTV